MHGRAILRDCLHKCGEARLFVPAATCDSRLLSEFFAFTCPVSSINMVRLSSALALVPLAASAAAQQLNTWPQKNYGGNGRATDNDITTTEEKSLPSAEYPLLFNFYINLSGLYIQSSGDFITDYQVSALLGDFGLRRSVDVGQVCGATGNFTFVSMVDPEDGSYVRSDTFFIEVSAAKGNTSTAVINEIWPVFPGDDIFDPENTSPCPVTATN